MRDFWKKHDRPIRCGVLALCVAAAFAVPLLHIGKYRNVRNEGAEFKFRCEGHDPYTPFLGRYLVVWLQPRVFKTKDLAEREYSPAYVKFRTGKDGFAKIASCSFSKPCDMTGVWEFPDRSFRVWKDSGSHTISFYGYPVDRYYLNEKLAKTADKLGISQSDMVATVRLKDGCGIITRLTIKGKDAEKYLREQK